MKVLSSLFIVILCLALGSCKKKGCTDKNSLNYDIMADEDDGSCVYCDSIITPVSAKTLSVIDNYPASPHYGQNVLQIVLTQEADTFSYLQCGTTGCKVFATVTSLVNESMNISFYINSGSPSFLNYSSNQVLFGHETKSIGVISIEPFSDCIPISNSIITCTLQSQVSYF